MRILFVVTRFPNLSETFILDQITGLISRGHDVTILASQSSETAISHPQVEEFNLLARTIYPQRPQSRIARVLHALPLFFSTLPVNGFIKLAAINFFKYGRYAGLLGLVYDAACFTGRSAFDVIHCHFGPNGNKAALLKRLGILQGRLVTTFHGYDLSVLIARHGPRFYSNLFSTGDLFLPISEHWKHLLIELGCDPSRIAVHRMGIDCAKFAFTPKQRDGNGPIRLLSIARLVEKKGIEYGVRAVSRLANAGKDCQYTIIGDGPLRPHLENLAAELRVTKRVHFAAWQPQQQVLAALENADILLAPSVTTSEGDQEGIPVALLEAMAKGVPVVATLHSGIPELVQDGLSGFLVPERNVDALAERLAFLIDHPERWPEMGRLGRRQVREHFDIDKLNDRLVEIYHQLVPSTQL